MMAEKTIPFFVNLPLRYIARDSSYLEFFLRNRIHPELGIDGTVLDTRDDSWHRNTAAAFHDHGLSCGVHLPFFDLQPGSVDDLIRSATRDRLAKALETAAIYRPCHLIGHFGYDAVLYSGENVDLWMERSRDTWKEVLSSLPDHPPLYLENVREQDPALIAEWLSLFGDPKVGFCLDAGHWFSFGRGSRKGNLNEWFECLGPFLGHVHLHDNHGDQDEHFGLGRGALPLKKLLDRIIRTGKPGITLEPHSEEDLRQTFSYFKRHPDWKDYLKGF